MQATYADKGLQEWLEVACGRYRKAETESRRCMRRHRVLTVGMMHRHHAEGIRRALNAGMHAARLHAQNESGEP
jgi:hypothetical protein